MLHKDCSDRLDLKDLTEDQGVFSGWLSKYNVVDRQSDIVVPGAFTKSLAKSGPRLPLLWMHKDPVGGVVLSERPEGLWAEGKLLPMREVPLARYAFHAMKEGVVSSMSIGYETVQREVKGDIRYLTEINLYEGSLVAVPALAEARIETVKNLFSSDTFDFIEEIDQEIKAGRALSKVSRERIQAAIDQNLAANAQLQALLNSESDEGDGKGIAKHSEESLANFQKALERAIQWKH